MNRIKSAWVYFITQIFRGSARRRSPARIVALAMVILMSFSMLSPAFALYDGSGFGRNADNDAAQSGNETGSGVGRDRSGTGDGDNLADGEQGSYSDSNADSDPNAASDSDVDSGSDAGSDSDVDSGSGADSDVDSGSDAGSDSDVNSGSDAGSDSDAVKAPKKAAVPAGVKTHSSNGVIYYMAVDSGSAGSDGSGSGDSGNEGTGSGGSGSVNESTTQGKAAAGDAIKVYFNASIDQDDLLAYRNHFVYVLFDSDDSYCKELKDAAEGDTVVVETDDGGTVTLHKEGDGFWWILDANNGGSTGFTLTFNSNSSGSGEGQPGSGDSGTGTGGESGTGSGGDGESGTGGDGGSGGGSGDDEIVVATAGLYMGAGIWTFSPIGDVLGLSAYSDASYNKYLADRGRLNDNAAVSLTWIQDEVDPEPVMDDEFTVSADPVYGYFHTELPANFHAVCGRGSDNNVFYVRQTADRSLTAILKDAKPGDVIPGIDANGDPIKDRYGNPVSLHITEDGFWFELDNAKHNNYADFALTYKATDDANAESSSPARMKLFLAQSSTEENAAKAASNNLSPELTLTWSDSGDKMHYAINLIWDTAVEEDKYDQEVVTTSQATLEPKYILDVMTTSVNYDPGKFVMELPYALWPYRGSESTGAKAAIPTQFSIPKEGDDPENSLFQYRIEYDLEHPNDLTKAKLVITNVAYMPAGTNARITVKYVVDPWSTVDLSKAAITVNATVQATNQKTPEYGESNTLTYSLDTGFDKSFLRKTSTWTSNEAAAVYTKPSGMSDDKWDPDNYNMVKFHINYGTSGYNQPLTYDFLTTLPEGAELVAVTPHTGGYHEIRIDGENGTWENYNNSKSVSSSTNDYWFYVRFPRTADGDADYHVRLDMDVTASDPDSHTPPEDYNDLGHQYLEWDFHWEDYVFDPGKMGTESYSKSGWGEDYIEAVKSSSTDVEFSWRMYVTTMRWDMKEGETQYLQLTDDAHFWKYVPSSYSTNDWRKAHDMHWMDEGSWEFSRITGIIVKYSSVNMRDGSTIYPDFAGGKLLIQASKDGKTWDDIKTIDVPTVIDRTGEYIAVPDMGKCEFARDSGYTRLRVISPEVGMGKLNVEVNFYSRLKSDSALIQKWLDECSDDQKVYVRNYAAYQHFIKDAAGKVTWDDQLKSPYSYATADGVSDGKTLAARDVEDEQYYDGTQEGYVRRAYANGQLRHFNYGAQIQKTTGETINDSVHHRAIVPFSVFEEEVVNGKQGEQYTEIYQDFSQDSGVFYDLLPPGYSYLDDSAWGQTVRGEDVKTLRVEKIDNFRGSGRQLVKFYVEKPDDPVLYTTENDTNLKNQPTFGYIFGKTKETQYKSNYTGNPHTGFRIEFQAYIPWSRLVSHPSETNLVTFQRTDDKPIRAGQSDQGYPNREKNFPLTDSQLIKELKGTASTSRPINYDKSATAAFDDEFKAAGGVRASGPSVFTDIDGDGKITGKSTLYAYSTANPQVVDGVQTGIYKRILGDEGKAAMEEGEEGWRIEDWTKIDESYSYKITTYASMGTMKGLIVYDTLEDAKNKEGAEGEVTWKGTFQSVDTTEAEKLGFAPVVYYSTVKGLDYNTITGDKEFIWINDGSIWTTELPEDKSQVTAVAVDLRRMKDGSEAVISSKESDDGDDINQVSFLINMKAPHEYPSDPDMIYAINRPAYSCYQKGFFSAEGVHKNDIGLRVKIRLLPPDEESAELPHTGGPGTRVIYLAGAVLTTIAAAVIVRRRRKTDASA